MIIQIYTHDNSTFQFECCSNFWWKAEAPSKHPFGTEKVGSNFGFLRYSTVESEFVIWIFVWKSSEKRDTFPGVVTEVPVADIHQLDDPDVIPRQGQLQIVTCLK